MMGTMPTLQVAIFALNEESTIQQVIRDVPQSIPGISRILITVIDDGSSDRTAELARDAGADVISHGHNRGLGTVFRSAVAAALDNNADILVTVDGDGQFQTGDIPTLLAPILGGTADMVTCSRFLDPELAPRMPAVKVWGNSVVARLVSALTGHRLHDASCGFRAYNRDCLIHLNLMGRFTYTHETLLELIFKRMRVVERALPVRGVREFGKSRVASNVFAYGWRTLRIIVGTVLHHRPHHVFTALAGLSAALGVILAVVGYVPFLLTGYFTKWAMFTAAFLFGLAVLMILFGMQARVLYRSQFLLEEILYQHRLDATRRRRDS